MYKLRVSLRLIATQRFVVSESSGCPGCVASYHWQVTGGRLSLALVGHESTGGPEDVAVVRFVTEGDFSRQS